MQKNTKKRLEITIILGLVSLLASSCSPVPMSVIVNPVTSKKIAAPIPVPNHPIKTYVTGDVSWGGKPAPFGIANGYFKSRLTNSLNTIPGFTFTKESEAELIIHVSRNNKMDSGEMNAKIRKVISKESTGEAITNNYDHFFKIDGNGKEWSGNVAHGMYFIVGDPSAPGIIGEVYSGTTSEHGGAPNFSETIKGEEAMMRQILIFALDQAKKKGCFK
jgi:hypothetical protein